MRAVLPPDLLDVDESNIDLIHERACLECMTGGLAAHVATGDPPQFVVDKWNQIPQRCLVTSSPLLQQRRDVWQLTHRTVSFRMLVDSRGSLSSRHPLRLCQVAENIVWREGL